MLTSRSEYRLLLRQDNADVRLTPLGREIGLVDSVRWQVFEDKQAQVAAEVARLKETKIAPEAINSYLSEIGSTPLAEKTSFYQLLHRPEVTYALFRRVDPVSATVPGPNALFIETEIKYAGYIQKQNQSVAQLMQAQKVNLPVDIDYRQIVQLSNEAREKLHKLRPDTLAQAMRIAGITPADIAILQVLLTSSGKALPRLEAELA